MAVCSFIGNGNLYDRNVYRKLWMAIQEIVQQNQQVDFLFYQEDRFFDLCLAAAWEAKQRYPQKQITLTKVIKNEDAADYAQRLQQGDTLTPPCVIDRVAAAPYVPVAKDFSVVVKKTKRWIIQQSTHVISYLYPYLSDSEKTYWAMARKLGAAVADVTDADTHAFIAQCQTRLKERERLILDGLREGQTLKQMAGALGISSSSVKQAAQKAGRELQYQAAKRLQEQPEEDRTQDCACSILALGEITFESLLAFEQAVVFLMERYDVTSFHILQEYCHSGYMSVLHRLAKTNPCMHLIAITHVAQSETKAAFASCCPPCHAAENIDAQAKDGQEKMIGAMEKMLGRSQFAICSLAGHPQEMLLRELIAKAPSARVLDISKRYQSLPEEN